MVFKAIFSRIRWRWFLKWRILAIEKQILADTRKMTENYPAALMEIMNNPEQALEKFKECCKEVGWHGESMYNPEQALEKFKEYENRCKEVRALALEIGWHEKWEEYENRCKVLAEKLAEDNRSSYWTYYANTDGNRTGRQNNPPPDGEP